MKNIDFDWFSVKDINLSELDTDIIKRWLFKCEEDVSRLKNELFRRDFNVNVGDHSEDLFDKFGLPNVDTKERQ
tara:strand:+ start:333 stop:554 length:222 start_codon:yes stop_codon:yes gene_type:complete